MKTLTKPEIKAWIEKTWLDLAPEEYKWRSVPETIKINIQPEYYEVTLSSEYCPPGLSLKHLIALSEFFGTQNITDERFSHGGCETCDYGSDYGFTLIIKPEGVK